MMERSAHIALGYCIIANLLQTILDLSISPDANVLATAGKDGHVKFWSISSSSSDQHVWVILCVTMVTYYKYMVSNIGI